MKPKKQELYFERNARYDRFGNKCNLPIIKSWERFLSVGREMERCLQESYTCSNRAMVNEYNAQYRAAYYATKAMCQTFGINYKNYETLLRMERKYEQRNNFEKSFISNCLAWLDNDRMQALMEWLCEED